MQNSAASGPPCETSGDWANETWHSAEAPEPTLERRLLASQWLVDVGLSGGSIEDIAYRLTVKLMQERHASKHQYDVLSAETKRYRSRFLMEREFCTDLLDENAELKGNLELLEAENGYNVEALVTAQERLDNALDMVDTLSGQVNWNLLLTNGDER